RSLQARRIATLALVSQVPSRPDGECEPNPETVHPRTPRNAGTHVARGGRPEGPLPLRTTLFQCGQFSPFPATSRGLAASAGRSRGGNLCATRVQCQKCSGWI